MQEQTVTRETSVEPKWIVTAASALEELPPKTRRTGYRSNKTPPPQPPTKETQKNEEHRSKDKSH